MQNPMATSSRKRQKSTMDKYFAPRTSEGAEPSIMSVLTTK